MHRLQLPFQVPHSPCLRFAAENPLAEVWAQVGRCADSQFVALRMAPDSASGSDWEGLVEYAAIRVQQSLELRNSAPAAGPSTAALPLYYAIPNLTRAVATLMREDKCNPSHGLRYKRGDHILEARADSSRGTFTDYLSTAGCDLPFGTSISLGDCLANVAEIATDQLHGGRRGPWRVSASLMRIRNSL